MFNVTWIEILLLLGVGLLVYAIVRWVRWRPDGTNAVKTAHGHALWTGVLAYLASTFGVQPALGKINSLANGPYQPQVWEPERYPDQSWSNLVTVLIPVALSLGIFLISQFTFPKPRGQVREASLSRRSIKDFLPRRLAVFGVAVWLGCLLIVSGIAWLPGFSPVQNAVNGSDLTGQTTQINIIAGRIEGISLAITLWIALLVLAGGALLTLSVIARRRSLEGLSARNNDTLRSIVMNRLLRIGILISCGIASAAVQFAALSSGLNSSGFGQTSVWSLPTFVFFITSVLVLLVVIASQPPKLDPDNGQDATELIPATALTQKYQAEVDAVESSNAARVLVIVGLAFCTFIAICVITATGNSMNQLTFALLLLSLGLIAQLFLLVGDSANWYFLFRAEPLEAAKRRWPLSWWILITSALSLLSFIGCGIYATVNNMNTLTNEQVPWPLLSLGGFLLLLAAAVVVAVAMSRPRTPLISPELDQALRRVSAFRAARFAAAAFFAAAAQLLSLVDSATLNSPRYSVGIASFVFLALFLVAFPSPTRRIMQLPAAPISPTASTQHWDPQHRTDG